MIKEHPVLKNVLVSDDGKIYVPSNGSNLGHWTYGSKMANGYMDVRINKHHYFVHRLVAETFVPNPNNLPCVDHRNHDRADNREENLHWVTVQENLNNTKRNRPVGKRLKDFESRKEYEKARARERYKSEPGYKEYHKEYLKNWRKQKRQSMNEA